MQFHPLSMNGVSVFIFSVFTCFYRGLGMPCGYCRFSVPCNHAISPGMSVASARNSGASLTSLRSMHSYDYSIAGGVPL